jgi:regulatory protein
MNTPTDQIKLKIRQSALTALTRRDYPQKDLTTFLQSKGFPLEDIEPVLETLAKAGLINESRFTENFIHWRRSRGYGPVRISQELQQRGIPEEMIAEPLQITDNTWFTEAQKVWQKHFKNKPPGNFKEKAKQMRFLQYRGFTQKQIESVFLNTMDEFD